MARFSTYFVPFDSRNPYQRMLSTHLSSLNVPVEEERGLKGLFCRIVFARKPAVIHLHWLPRFESKVGGLLRMLMFYLRLRMLSLLRLRFVWTAHNLYSHEGSSRGMERWLTRRVVEASSRVIAHSETARQLVAKEFNIPENKTVVVPHGNYIGAYQNTVSRLEARKRLNVDPGDLVILFLGNIRPYKGVTELIDAFRGLDFAGCSLVIAGRPLNPETTLQVEKKLAGCARIQFRPGYVPDEEVQIYMNASDLVVFPYHDVLTSGAVVLAMSFGRACVAPAIGCIPDMLDERGAFLYDPTQPNALEAALARAVQGRERLAEMGAWNLERAREWDWSRVARETAQVYLASMA